MLKRLLLTLLVLFVLLLIAAGVLFGIGYYLSPQSQLQKSDAIVAISGGETQERALEAIKLYQQGWAPVIIFSGAAADSSGPSNAKAMAIQAEQAGVPASDILLDKTSENTEQNATNVASIIHEEGYTSIILVTSPYHQRRADIVFRRALGPNVTILDHSAVDTGWRRSDWWATSASRQLTFAELSKVIYELAHGSSQ
jgi:uncharacterized SAM-binding protein YcdF (DUF218 family)